MTYAYAFSSGYPSAESMSQILANTTYGRRSAQDPLSRVRGITCIYIAFKRLKLLQDTKSIIHLYHSDRTTLAADKRVIRVRPSP